MVAQPHGYRRFLRAGGGSRKARTAYEHQQALAASGVSQAHRGMEEDGRIEEVIVCCDKLAQVRDLLHG